MGERERERERERRGDEKENLSLSPKENGSHPPICCLREREGEGKCLFRLVSRLSICVNIL